MDSRAASTQNETSGEESARDVQQTTCCIVGSGPAGAFLALLLARKGVPVILLEAHPDFEREFRADSVHPAIMENLELIGLADALLQLRHTTMKGISFITREGTFTISDFTKLHTKYPYMLMVPQARFLEFLTSEAERYPDFRLIMGARVEHLVEEGGEIRGVVYRGADGFHEVRAALTVGADGRFSRSRQLAGLVPETLSPPMDILWFYLPRKEGDPDAAGALHLGPGHFAILFDHFDSWQVGYAIRPGSYQEVREAGLEPLRRSLAELVPWLSDRVDALQDWNRQISLLSVQTSRVPRWYRPGLLLIGDAAHTMNPVGGFGNNLAIQDAIATANILAGPLLQGTVEVKDLAALQRRRMLPTKILQRFQTAVQGQIDKHGLSADKPFRVPLFFRILRSIPGMRSRQAALTAFGIRRERISDPGTARE
jgi:2-polyprenyl-6-methoxyphenol hydroxylase-like FAD-dependent oxidoreductase